LTSNSNWEPEGTFMCRLNQSTTCTCAHGGRKVDKTVPIKTLGLCFVPFYNRRFRIVMENLFLGIPLKYSKAA